ncbi:hypothetical protein [Streptomyces sp. NPDC090025]|uniref:hypothetical protein n=1 Tax=Streptomyces sp. NPDC090025 TaxID=3365922 RepID=UPI0038373A9C
MTTFARPTLLGAPSATLTTVVVAHAQLAAFRQAAREEYRACTPEAPPAHFAVLVGTVEDDAAHVIRVEHAENVRAVDATARAEFAASIVPCFGAAYANTRRGYWCSSRDLLRIHRAADRDGLDVIGSIHLHPDWHHIGPPPERTLRISQRPTPMDRHMFAETGYPVNMICYLESPPTPTPDPGHGPTEFLAAWSPPETPGASDCPELTIKYRDS